MSTFSVIAELRHKKFSSFKLEEHYTEWALADAAFCAYSELVKLPSSSVLHVDLIEHREEVVRKSASKAQNTNNVVALGGRNGTAG